MPNLLAMSFEGELAPSIDLRCLEAGHKLPDGWGIGYYPGGEPSASVLKEPAPAEGSYRSEILRAWEHLASSLFVLHIRAATWGNISDANTQPFSRSFAGRDWLFAHSGSMRQRGEALEGAIASASVADGAEPVCVDPACPALAPSPPAAFEPVGSTDTELIFCRLLAWLAAEGCRSLADVRHEALQRWFFELNAHGSMTCVLTDGRDLCVYSDRNGDSRVHLWNVLPPYDRLAFGDQDVELDLTRRGTKSRKGVVLSSHPLESSSDARASWTLRQPGSLLIVRQGAVLGEVQPTVEAASGTAKRRSVPPPSGAARPLRAEVRRLEVRHRTVYRYNKAVDKSTHLLRLVPIHDRLQSLLSHELHVSVGGKERSYEDVFGNQVRRVVLEAPYTELVIDARSRVELRDIDPLSFRPLHARSTIPLAWMPWQRHMLQPYLLPPELPDSELEELVEYAMSFVHRNDSYLLDTLLDINWTIYKEYQYRQGSTNILTTPFDVYVNRRGVCQDFANLFICLARLLGVPARYVCGYLYTGPKHANQAQAEASHAWVQVYLPEVGWKGFDPTNGVLTQTDHVRVAVGRMYVDATPTSGTIFVGGGAESLEVDVRCELID